MPQGVLIMRSTVLDGFAVNPGDLSWDFLSRFGEYSVYDSTPPELVAERLSGTDIVLTNRVKITPALLDSCKSIKFVTALGTGYDMIDVRACRERGVEVCNAPGYSTDSVAQLAFSLLLALTNDLNGFRKIVRDGGWTGVPGIAYQKIPCMELGPEKPSGFTAAAPSESGSESSAAHSGCACLPTAARLFREFPTASNTPTVKRFFANRISSLSTALSPTKHAGL